jgi:hypothetical protein
MAKSRKQAEQLQEVLADPALRKRVRNASSEAAAVKLVTTAGRKVGVTIDPRWLRDQFIDVRIQRGPVTFSERELLLLAGRGGSVADSANKLCHTESCGGTHGGCC